MSLNQNYIKKIIGENFKSKGFKGYNPYDYLLSPLSKYIKYPNINKNIIQLFKLSPINARPLLRINETFCHKSLALLMTAYCMENDIKMLTEVENILNKRKISFHGADMWGFEFPIILSHYSSQERDVSLIITLFVMYSYIQYYKIQPNNERKKQITNVHRVFSELLPSRESHSELSYSYVFDSYDPVYNATAKVGKYYALCEEIGVGEKNIQNINKILNYLVNKLNIDNIWKYSDKAQYSDGYHMAFILDSFRHMLPYSTNMSHYNAFRNANRAYYKSFISDTGQPNYYHKKYLPKDVRRFFTQTDIRDCAMGIICAISDKNEHLATQILKWTITNMYDSRGYFYHYYENCWTNRIQYMRPQAWMFLALTKYSEFAENHA
jgi:hypothetical protein